MAYVRTRVRYRGLADAQSAASKFQQGSSLALSTGGGVATALAPHMGLIFGLAPTTAIPIIGAALVGITFAVTKLIQNSGCGPTCIQATEYANKSADLMQQNMKAYFALPAPRPRSAQAQALANFDALWQQLVTLCSDPKLGDPGKRCISERQPGGKYDDARYNRDPIANDPNVVDDSQLQLSQSGIPGLPGVSFPSGVGASLPLVAAIGLIAVGVALL